MAILQLKLLLTCLTFCLLKNALLDKHTVQLRKGKQQNRQREAQLHNSQSLIEDPLLVLQVAAVVLSR